MGREMEPQAKRAKADGAALLPGLTAWLDREGVWWDDEAMQIKESKSPNGSSLSIHSRRPLPAGHHLCTIPKDACLSVRNASCSDIIMEENMCSGLGLVMAVMHERLLGPKSRWHGYFCSLPEREYLPVFWGPEELALLQGTELGDAIHDELDCVRSDYTDQIEPLIAKHGLEGMKYSFPAFQAAASLVASRAFKVDDAVGDAMVPLADVFNHKASVVALSDQYAVYEGEEGEDSSDDSDSDADEEEEQEGEDTEDAEGDEEGAASGSEAASESLGSSEASGSGGEGSGSPRASPGAGTMLTSQLVPPSFLADAEPELHGLRSANGLSLALEICIVDDEEGAALRILTASPIGEGREVHNTYGELGNRDLLEKYGFTLPENPHDSVTLELEPLWAWGAARHGAREWEARRAFLDANTPWLRRRRYAAVVVHPNGHMPAWCIAAAWLTAAQRDPALPMWEDAEAALGPEVHEALLADPSATMSVLEGALREAAPPDFAEALRALAEPKLQRLLAGSPATDNLDGEVADLEGGRLSDRKTARLTSGQLRASELAILRPLVQTRPQ